MVVTAGVGSDHVDLEAARAHGITVAEVTGSNVVRFGQESAFLLRFYMFLFSVAEHGIVSLYCNTCTLLYLYI